MVFHEITPPAIQRAVEDWRDLDRRLVDAQEARRILDRLYGYEVSPVLWKKVMPRLSAGRVQSVATRMVVERERARMRFRSATWWGVEGTFAGAGEPPDAADADRAAAASRPTLVAVDGTPLATGRDFAATGELEAKTPVRVLAEDEATSLAEGPDGAAVRRCARSTSGPSGAPRPPPFMTSTLQQEAGRKLRFSAQRAMQVAQRLYEQGWITYMRTDSTDAVGRGAAGGPRPGDRALRGRYVPRPAAPLRAQGQERPGGPRGHPAGRRDVPHARRGRAQLRGDELRLYDLIWKRTVASQMADATGTSAQVRLRRVTVRRRRLGGPRRGRGVAEFAASGQVITFPGFLRAYVEGEDDPEAELADREVHLPPLAEGDAVTGDGLRPGSHTTQPPARYTEASLVKAMEELGVGRPSTYASVIATILDRGYVWKKGTALVPSFTAFAVVGLLERYFGDLVDYGFTAAMEDDLDEIAERASRRRCRG